MFSNLKNNPPLGSMEALLIFLLLVTVFPINAIPTFASPTPQRIAILELNNKANLSSAEVGYLTDLIRDAAREQLPVSRFVIMTRENIFDLLGEQALSDCLGDCAVETGRNLGAKYVVAGEVISFGKSLRLSITLHETETSNLLESEQAQANEVEELEGPVRDMGFRLLNVLRPRVVYDTTGAESVLGADTPAWQAGGTTYTIVEFESQPSGATVELDGDPLCVTPCSQPLPRGHIEVAFKLLRYQANTQVIEITEKMEPITATLKPNFGWLTVLSDQRGLEVEVDGKGVGTTPIDSLAVNPGVHDIWVRDEYRHDKGQRVVIERGEKEVVTLNLSPINGGLQVESYDSEGRAVTVMVWVDDVEIGPSWSPLTIMAGPRNIELRGDSGTWKKTLTIPRESLLVTEATVSSTAPNMILIPAGTFPMGSPSSEKGHKSDENQRQITLTRDILMSTTEVTQNQYLEVTGRNPSHFISENRPVENISWFDAIQFCNQLSQKEGLQPAYEIEDKLVTWKSFSNGYRLPTEAEWEYACRAGSTNRFNLGDDDSHLMQAGWFVENSAKTTHPVAQKLPNHWGLYDMHGNVWEWCWDWYGRYPSGKASDPVGAASNTRRIVRGGYYFSHAVDCRVARRSFYDPDYSYNYTGFRIVRQAE